MDNFGKGEYPTPFIEHRTQLEKGHSTLKVPSYKMSHVEKDILSAKIDNMLSKNIEESESLFVTSPIMVPILNSMHNIPYS